MLRAIILAVAQQRTVRGVFTGGVGRRVALRFVAGERLEDALEAIARLNGKRLSASVDYLGENVTEPAVAAAATETYRSVVERISASGLDASVSVKLTQMGLDLDPEFALGNAALIAHRVAEAESSLTFDMEDHRYTEAIIDACLRLHHRHPGRIGVAIQAYLYRSEADLERVLEVPVRLCKGAYLEPREIAYPAKAEVDASFRRLTARLMKAGRYPMIATHDERLIRSALREAAGAGRTKDSFEFQMLYGIRRDLQRRLHDDGYRVRVYVPFGAQWYPYLMRRIAERPANLRFFLSQLRRG